MFAYTAGPLAGLRQIVGVFDEGDSVPEKMPAHPDPPAPVWPDGRLARFLRLKSTDRYVLYSEGVA